MTQSYVKALGGPHAARNLLSQQVGETQMPTLLAWNLSQGYVGPKRDYYDRHSYRRFPGTIDVL